ncbi:hypothetical protein AZI85_03540 [Bdellovibrio bacteriovorus]|uniref:Tox-PL domain-containing protein n=1 Tax=Bdellovibrio bacteriovorus TaxID=959 RepID=A0A150WKK3_BDEBC|nr:hypothetical protein [Bdellovibrio bacteriovorus]KYG64500.1 hypothetical protein AZI85_03540 [Bdellovibrio bacteriovorus]
MRLSKRLLHILLSFTLFASSSFAFRPEELQELVLTGDLYGRSSVDFRKKARNVQFLVPEGTEGTVVETRKLSRTGSYGIKVKVTKVGGKGGKNVPKVGDETWVYFSQKDPWLTFKDRQGSEVQDPELALTSRAIQDGAGLPIEGTQALPHLPTKEEVLREQKPEKPEDPNLAKNTDPKKTEGDFCATCSSQQKTPAEKNREDLNKVGKAKVTTKPEVPDPKWSNYPTVSKYSTSKEVEASIKYGMRNKERRSKKLCYRYVKRALLGGDLVGDYLPGSKARYAVGDLKRRGFTNMLEDSRFKNLIKSPADAPKGAILVYRNTRDRNHAGHAEIKTDWGKNGGYVSDFYRSTKQPLYNRELIGVMIKESK